MSSRPRINITPSPFDNKITLWSKIFLAIMWGLTLFSLIQLPTTIPTHFNAQGQTDAYGDKMTILIFPIMATVIFIGLNQLVKYPHIFNYMTKITEKNAEEEYSMATTMVRGMNLAVLFIFTSILLINFLIATGVIDGLGNWFLPLTFVILLIPTIRSIRRSFKK